MPIRVQIVDSQPVVRRGLIMFLTTDTDIIVVGESANGREALNIAKQLQPDVILMDLLLPDINSAAIIRTFREQQPTIHIIALSSSTDYSLIASAILAGVDTYLLKGDHPTQLLTTIKSIVAGRVLLAPALRQQVLNELPPLVLSGPLTPSELVVLKRLAAIYSDDEIAQSLQMTRGAVQSALHHIQTKLSAPTRLLTVLRATQLGLIEPEAAS